MFITLNMNDEENECIGHGALRAPHEIRAQRSISLGKLLFVPVGTMFYLKTCALCLVINLSSLFLSLPILLSYLLFLFYVFPSSLLLPIVPSFLPYPWVSPSSYISLSFFFFIAFNYFLLPSTFQEEFWTPDSPQLPRKLRGLPRMRRPY